MVTKNLGQAMAALKSHKEKQYEIQNCKEDESS